MDDSFIFNDDCFIGTSALPSSAASYWTSIKSRWWWIFIRISEEPIQMSVAGNRDVTFRGEMTRSHHIIIVAHWCISRFKATNALLSHCLKRSSVLLLDKCFFSHHLSEHHLSVQSDSGEMTGNESETDSTKVFDRIWTMSCTVHGQHFLKQYINMFVSIIIYYHFKYPTPS